MVCMLTKKQSIIAKNMSRACLVIYHEHLSPTAQLLVLFTCFAFEAQATKKTQWACCVSTGMWIYSDDRVKTKERCITRTLQNCNDIIELGSKGFHKNNRSTGDQGFLKLAKIQCALLRKSLSAYNVNKILVHSLNVSSNTTEKYRDNKASLNDKLHNSMI